MSSEELQQLLDELKQGLKKIYGRQLVALLLYGSFARGEQDTESDLDILIILDNYALYSREIKRTSELISRKILRHKTWITGDTPLLRNARREAIPA